MRQSTLFIAVLLLATPCALAQQATNGVQSAEKLIQSLASDNYQTREEATDALKRLGRPAIEPLESAAKADDPEVRMRSAEILIEMRGRGFLGVGLSEEESAPVAENEEPAGPPFVVANQVVNFQQYAAYGVTKPFPAERIGLQPGDKIITVNDRPINGVKDLMREVIIIGPARVAQLVIERDGKRQRMAVVLTRNPLLQRINAFGGINAENDPTPQVDLEKELPPDDQTRG